MQIVDDIIKIGSYGNYNKAKKNNNGQQFYGSLYSGSKFWKIIID